MTIQFYGAPASSSGRTHFMLEECGVAYDYHRVNTRDPAAKAEYLKINPAGMVPYLIDGDFRMTESIAINFYLAEKYAPALWASTPGERARIYEISLWAITNLQPAAMDVMYHSFLLPAERRHADLVDEGKHETQQLLDRLEASWVGPYALGDRYCVADVNLASAVHLADRAGAGKPGPRVAEWLAGVRQRPAWLRLVANS